MKYEVNINVEKKRQFRKPITVYRKIGFLFNMSMWQRLSAYTQLSPGDWQHMKDASLLPKIFYCACKQWHVDNNLAAEWLTEEKVNEWVESLSMKQGKELIDVLFNSQIGGESLNELIPRAIEKAEEVKKKLRGMT